MKTFKLVLALSCLSLLALCGSPAFANGIRADIGASGKGTVNPPGGCAANFATNPECVDFSTSGALPVWTAFEADNSDPNNIIITKTTGPENLFVVSGISSITFQLLGNANYGSFLCGSQDGMADLLSQDCTKIVDQDGLGIDPPTDLSSFLTEDDSLLATLNQVTFNFMGGTIGTSNGVWVFYADAGEASILSTTPSGGTTTPEPGTLFLVAAGAGLLALAKFRRA